jgi:glycerol uptake facilitator-like aquaporin
MHSLLKKSVVEFFGTALLVCVVVGSGIMGTNLSSDDAVALIVNAISTIFALALLILVLGPVSGAHFNPVVTFVRFLSKDLNLASAAAYSAAQVAGAIVGAIVANAMFDLSVFQISSHLRVSTGTLIGEVIATAGLVALIQILISRKQDSVIAVSVAAWIGSAYFFTSSTSFANPAVTVGRIFSDTFAGIAPASVLPFILAQVVGGLIGFVAARALRQNEKSS